jgi:hypothetical protein
MQLCFTTVWSLHPAARNADSASPRVRTIKIVPTHDSQSPRDPNPRDQSPRDQNPRSGYLAGPYA